MAMPEADFADGDPALLSRVNEGSKNRPVSLRSAATTSKEGPMDIAQAESMQRVALARLPTQWGNFEALAFERHSPRSASPVETAVAIFLGDLTHGAPLLRIHSQCLTAELFSSLRCDCADQLDIAMRKIAKEGRGLVIYEHQEGRGIG